MNFPANILKLIGILIGISVGGASAWTLYGDQLLLTNQTASNHGAAESQCGALGGLVVSPVWDSIQTAVIDAAITLHPAQVFWTGFKRNANGTYVNGTWTSAFYHASIDMLPWGRGVSTDDPGNCLAMEVLPTGITYHPDDCNTSLDIICHLVTGNHFFNTSQTEYLFPNNATFSKRPNVSEDECSGLCLMEFGCVGYNYTSLTSECTTFTSLTNSNISHYTLQSGAMNATLCCTPDGSVVVECCMFNGTAMASDCIAPYGGTMDNVTECLSLNTDVVMPHWRFGVTARTGCLAPDDPANGTIIGISGTMIGAINAVGCRNNFKLSPRVNYTCGVDFRWSGTPYCKHEAQPCPPGWVQYGFYCYLVDLKAEPLIWDDQRAACHQHNAFPLHVESRKEAHFLNRLLHFHANVTFWTGTTNREGHFRFTHNYDESEDLRWYEQESDDVGCVTLERIVDGSDHGEFYNNVTSCDDSLPYICQMGSSVVGGVCGNSKACRGFGECNWNGKCKCWSPHSVMVGPSGDNMTYCSTSWEGSGDYLVLETKMSLPWPVAVSMCKDLGGSLYSPVTRDLEQVGLDQIWKVGSAKTSWTAMYTDPHQHGEILTTGFVPYEFVDYEFLAWKRPPVFGSNGTGSCIASEISELGARLYAISCDSSAMATCFKYNDTTFSPFIITDNNGLVAVITIERVISAERCGLECLSQSRCLSFTHCNSTCHLYNTTGTGARPDSATEVHRKIAACSQPFSPWHGSHVVDGGNTVGTGSRQYQCDSAYTLPSNYYNDTFTCQANGRWGQIPMCITDPLRCPIGWEQYQTNCYYLSDYKLTGWSSMTWAGAQQACISMDSYLLEVSTREELDFVSKMLDVNCYGEFWTGGNDQFIPSVFSWSTNKYAEMKYLPFPSIEDGLLPVRYDDLPSCLALKSVFNDTDLPTSFLVEDSCSTYKRYVCFKKLLAVGSYNCSQYGQYSCAINSQCVDNKCVCDESFFQVGPDDDMATTCEQILPIGKAGCNIPPYGNIDGLCTNSSICDNGMCQCSISTFQNGPDGSLSTSCVEEMVTCPDSSWIYYNNHCYKVITGVFTNIISEPRPPVAADHCCGKHKAHLTTIHSQADNDFFMLLGNKRSTRWIGYQYSTRDLKSRWVDNSTIDFINFGYMNTNITSDYCTYMDEVGYWRQANCGNEFEVTDVVCERTARCKALPVVVNGSYSSTLVAEIGTTYTYSCNAGYILDGSHSGTITCQEVDRESLWTAPPICSSLLENLFDVYTGHAALYGLQIGSSVVTSHAALCADECYNIGDCAVFGFQPGTLQCSIYSNKSESNPGGLVSLPNTDDIWTRNYGDCGPVPHVGRASYNLTGTGPGSKVKYRCQAHYKMDRTTPGTLACTDHALWDQPKLPVCISRFERTNSVFPNGYKSGKAVYKIYSIDDCELACMEETQYRCVRCSYYHGVCYLFDTPHQGNRGDYKYLDIKGFQSESVSSELIDADLEEFDLWYQQTVDIPNGEVLLTTDGQSAEMCAQDCIYHNCTVFTYHRLNLTCAVFAGSLPTITPMPSDSDSQLYIRRYVCAPPPTVANASVEMVLQQVLGSYSIGDRAQVECLIAGQERVNNHNGGIECQQTGQWTSPPACRNLCPDGWYMKDYMCYKLYHSTMTFWDAYDACHLDDAGLVNIQTLTELQMSLTDVWNWTGAAPTSYWLGAYTDVSIWKWSERLADDVLGVLPSLFTPNRWDRLGVAVYLPGGAVNEAPVTDTKHFICKRAAAKLACPTGWEKYERQCLKVFNDAARDYADAIIACQAEGSFLASVPAVFAADVIGDLVTDAGESLAYVGLHKPINGMYKFEDGTRLLHKYLMTKEVESDHSLETCGTLAQDYVFGASPCTSLLPFVCQKPLDEFGMPTDFSDLPCSTDHFCNDTKLVCAQWKDKSTFLSPKCIGIACHPPWVYINGRCYWFSNKYATYPEAVTTCLAEDSEVFVPNDVKENYNIFFWLQSIPNAPTAVHIGIEKLGGATHIAMDTKRTPEFIHTVNANQASYILGVKYSSKGNWNGIGGDHITTACERDAMPKQHYDYLYDGCYTEVTIEGYQDLSERALRDSTMTVDMCATHCRGHGYKYCGIMVGDTCMCGNTRGRHGRLATASCDISCPGDNTQICGGNSRIAVYRVTASACADTMPIHPTDPAVCYAFVNKSLHLGGGATDCLLQGSYFKSTGQLISMENPYVEETVYHQVLRSILRPSTSNETETAIAVSWIGLSQLGDRLTFQWASGLGVNWALLDGENEHNFWKFGAIVNITRDGLWEESYTFVEKYPYACQIVDGSQNILGDGIQHRYTPTGTVQTVREGDFGSAREFGYGCLINRARCSKGFTIMMWVKVIDLLSNHHILSTGDCMTDLMGGTGFCLSYLAANQSILAMDFHNTTCKRLEVLLQSGVDLSHMALYFTNETDIYMYMDGNYKGQLQDYPDIKFLVRGGTGHIDVNYNDASNIQLENVTFIAGPPDQVLMEMFRDNRSFPSNQNSTTHQVWKDYSVWGVDLSHWGSAGVDGDGLSLSHKAFTYDLGQTTKEWLADPTESFTLAVWIKIPSGVKENIDILTFGGGYETLFSMSYSVSLGKVTFSVATTSPSYSGTYSFAFDEWQHFSLTFSMGYFSVYLNGDLVGSLGKWTAVTGQGGNYTVKVYTGSAVCPLGWTKNGLSCYFKGQAPSNEFWQQEHYCQQLGGHLVTVDTGQEMEFLEEFLYNSDTVYTGVFDQLQFPSQLRTWFDTRGYRHGDKFISDPIPHTLDRNFVSLYFDPSFNVSVPRVSGNGAVNLSAIGNTTNTTAPDDSFSGVTACEINLTGKPSRRQLSMECSEGWYYLYDRCYKWTELGMNVAQAVLECNKDRAILAQITTTAKQIYLSNWIKSITNEVILYLGLQLRQPLVGNASFLWSDMRPLLFTSWGSIPGADPGADPGAECVVMNCTRAAASCLWQSVTCDSVYPALCEKSADTPCGPGWRLYKDKCVSTANVTSAVEGWDTCLASGAVPLSLITKADTDEYIYTFGLGSSTCLTAGVLDISGNYVWNSPSALTSSDLCVGLDATGPIQRSCDNFDCVICQHYVDGGMSIDNIHIKTQLLDDNAVNDLYLQEVYTRMTYMWDMESYNQTTVVVKGSLIVDNTTLQYCEVELATEASVSITTDPTMGNVLQITESLAGAVYNLSQSDTCLQSIVNCKQGITVMFWVMGTNISNCVLVDTTTNQSGSTGIKVWLDDSGKRLYASVTELNYVWEGWIWMVTQDWVHIAITWQRNMGLRFHTNFRLVYTVSRRQIIVFTPLTIPSSTLAVGVCTDAVLLLLDNLEVYNYALESREVLDLQKTRDIEKVIDFNVDVSTTNVNLEKNSSLTGTVWRNSLFQTMIHVDNPTGQSPAMYSEQLPHCFTRADLCSGPFTTSLWLRPMNMESDQVFLTAGTNMDMEMTSLKIRYDSYADTYILEVFYDKTHFTIHFYLNLYQWSHLVINGDLTNSELLLYVNGQLALTTSTVFVVDRMPPQYDVTFLHVGAVGTFYIDDIRHYSSIKQAKDIYVLKSCHEYELAGFHETQEFAIDLDPWDDIIGFPNNTCELQNYQTFHFTMDQNEMSADLYNITLEDSNANTLVFTEGVLNDAVILNTSGLIVNITSEKCFRSVAHCYFGFTLALWVRLQSDQVVSGDQVIVMRMGGNLLNNESGVVMVCTNGTGQYHSDSALCSLVLVNHTRKWSTTFHILYNRWLHLAITWNPYHTLHLYKNGHLISDFGAITTTEVVSGYSFVNQSGDSLCIGCSLGNTGFVMAVDELYLLDMDMSQEDIRKIYGTHHLCSEDWRHLYHTDMCYHFSSVSASRCNSELACQSFGGNLADEVDLLTHQHFGQMADLDGLTAKYYLNYQQLPREGTHALRVPDGSVRSFASFNLPSTTSTRKCGMLLKSTTWIWDDCNCNAVHRYLCQTNPWFAMGNPLFLNHSVVSPSPDVVADQWTGDVGYKRGVTLTSMTLNNTHIHQVLSDRCLVNHNFCHNGLTISFWLLACNRAWVGEKQTVLSTMGEETGYGLAVYWNSSAALVVEVRTESNFTRRVVSISECHWNNVVISMDNKTDVQLFVNGKEAVAQLTYNETDTAERYLGEEAHVSVGSQFDGSKKVVAMLDNVTIFEHQVLDTVHLHNTVYDNFPDFHLSFDNHSLVLPSSGVTSNSGWHGDCLTFDGSVSSQFEGLLYQDCLVNSDLCWDGFTLSIWLRPTEDTLDQGILSARRDYSGLAIAYYTSYEGLANRYWLIVQESNVAHNIPFNLYTHAWSNIILAWYNNGSTLLYVNGIDQGQPVTTTAVTTGNPPQPTTFTLGDISGYTERPADTFQGAIDEFWFRPRPQNSSTMLELYKNSTYVRSKFVESFEVSPPPEHGRATCVQAVFENGSSLVSGMDWVNLTGRLDNQSSCVLDIDRCLHGFTINLYLQISLENDTDQVIFTTGGHDPQGLGIALLYTAMNKSLPFRRYFEFAILTSSMEYRTWFNMQWSTWNLVTLIFHPMFGVKVHVDDVLSSLSDSGTVRSTSPTVTIQHLLIGDIPSETSLMGSFAVDEFQILDRARFDGELWMQYVHTDLQVGGGVALSDVTRDECHHLCDNTTCSVFAFCDDQAFGTCVVYPVNVTSNFSKDDTHHHPSCDLFTKIITPTKVQKYGCFDTLVTSDLLQLMGPADVTSCIEACTDTVPDARYAGFHLNCHCGIETAPLAITHGDYDINPTCGQNEFLIYQLSGLREFLNVTVPITSLDVTLDPGTAVLVDQDLSVTMVALAELAFAGFSISAGDSRATFYTGRNYTSLVYPHMGLYILQIVALNEISWKTVSIPVYVLTTLEGVEIYSDNITATDIPLAVKVKVLGGNFVTCTLQYGDGLQDIVYHENTSEPFLFSHIYSQENDNMLNVSCTNNVSDAGNTKTVVSLHAVVNLTLLVPHCYPFGDIINITWFADRGSNTSVLLYHNDSQLFYGDYATLTDPKSLLVNSSVYQVTGMHTFNLTATNAVSTVLHETTSVTIGKEIDAVKLNTSKQFFKVNEMLSCDLSVFNTSTADIFINFDDGTIDHHVFSNLLSIYKYSVTHSFLSSGSFLMNANASNCLNSVSDSFNVIVEYPVDVLSAAITTVANPVHPLKVNLTLVNVSSPHPTSAVCDVQFGDGASDTLKPLFLVDGNVEMSHNYSINGIFTISSVCHNNVSTFSHTEIVQVGSHIVGLSVDTIPHLAQGNVAAITIDLDAGSLLLYSIDFGDGSPLHTTSTPVTYPDTRLDVTHLYTQIAVYTLTVTAVNSFGTVVNNTVTVSIMEEASGLIFYGDTISKINWSVRWYVRFVTVGTDTCIHFSPGDGVNYVFGGANCPLKPRYAGYIYTASTGNSLSLTHSYSLADTYIVTVQAENEVSVENAQMSIVILEFPCTFPKVTIMGFSSNSSKPSYSYPSVALTLRALADTYCMPIHNVVFVWSITRPDGGSFNEAAVNMASLPYLYIPPLSLRYGLYAINVTIYIEGYHFFNDTSIVYLHEHPTPLILELVGGEKRTVALGNSVALNASNSLDADFPIHGVLYDMTWYCWMNAMVFDPIIHENSVDLRPVEYCNPSLAAGAGDNTTAITIPAADLASVMTKTVVAKMTMGNQVRWKVQHIMVTDTSVSPLSITCMENCYSVVSAALPVRMKGECLTCTQYNRLHLTYAWSLYRIIGSDTYLIDYLDIWTYTGIDRANLAIKPGLLEAGEMYEIRLESGNDYTTRTFRVTWPPYNGKCSTNIDIGTAFRSKFIVSCSGWLDEGEHEARDLSVDQQYTRNFEFTFYFSMNTSSGYRMTPFFRVLGSWATAPEVMLGEGDPNNNHQVELVVTVKDFYGSVTTVTNTVKVMPPVYTTLETTNCNEMLLYEAEMDMMGILMLANGVTHRLLQDTKTNGENLAYDVEVITATIGKMTANGNLIQDEVLAANAVDTLNNMLYLQNTVGNLTVENKMKIGDSYLNIINSLQNRFKPSMSSAEKQDLAKDLFSGVLLYAQSTKYPADCSNNNCEEQLAQGQYVTDFISITHNISAIFLEDKVTGEEETIFAITVGNAVLSVQRRETLEVLNSTLSLEGRAVVDVPDLSGAVNCDVNNYIDVEILVSDNLYTTDVSWAQVKAQTTSIALIVDREVLQVANLVTPITVRSQPHILSDLTFTLAKLSSNIDTNLFYIQLTANESNITPIVVLRSFNQNVTLRYYVKVGSPPTQDDYDVRGLITSLELQDISGNGTLWQAIIQLTDAAIAISLETSSSKLVYLGLHAENGDRTLMLQVALYVLDCLFWDNTMKQWARNGLMLGNVTSYVEAPCESTHLTTFGTNVFVPPNTIDFNTVWSKFSADNVAVIATVGGLFVVYFLVLLYVRRADKRDVAKWAIYPLCDNLSTDRYHYQMTVYTGLRQNSGTTSKVFFVIGGEDGDTEVRAVDDSQSRPLTRGSVNNYLLSVPFNLGSLVFLRIWHDNAGKGKNADWFLNMVLIKDLQNDNKYVFLCNQWLAVDKGDQEVERLLPVATHSELNNFDHLFYTRTRQDLTDGHLWLSVLSRPTQSVFTRVQRLSCCLSLLFLTMVTNAMWYGTIDTTQQQNVHLGPFSFSGQELITSIAGSLIVVPVSIIIITFFKKAERRRPKYKVKVDQTEPEEDELHKHDKMASKKGLEQYCSDECSDEPREGCISPSVIDTALIQPFNMYKSWADFENRTSHLINSRTNRQKASDEGRKRKRNPLPFWCLYLAWALVVLSVLASGFFVILYSIEWGTEKSSRWLTAFFLSFIESVLLVQPLKVITVALVLILVFKHVDDDDEEGYVNEIVSPDTVSMVTNQPSPSYPAHRRPYKARPSNYTHLESAREHRKRINRLFNIGRELGSYIVYLVVVCILTYENRSKNAYPTYSHLENTFLKPPTTKSPPSFINISSAEYFWNWSHDILIPGLYSDGMYSGNDTADYQGYLSDNVHYRVGTPRIRQARVTKADCRIPAELKQLVKVCYPDYGLDTYDSESFGEGWDTVSYDNTSQAWRYKDSTQLNGYPVVAKYDSYGGGGYVTTLGNTNDTAAATFDYLHSAGWIDRNTRAVMVEANIYNPNVNLFCVLCFVLEFPASGSIIPYSQITPVVLYRYVGSSALFLLILDFIFVAFTLYYLYILVNKVKQEKCDFFKQFWNVIDVINMAFSITACAFYGMHFIMVELATSDFHRNKDAYLNLQYIVLWEALFGYMLAFLLFLSMLKLLLILRFNPKITQLSGTLRKAKGPIANFMVVFVLTFVAFAQFGYLVFGRVDRGYYTFITTLETLMSMLMMKMEIDNMILVNGLLGSLFVFLFVLVIVFILINMLLSVINDAFTEVRKDPSFLPDDPAMAAFLFDQIKALVLGYSKDSTKKEGREKTKEDEKNLEGKIDDLDLRLRTFLQALHMDRA